MVNRKKPPVIIKDKEFWQEWWGNTKEFEVDVYVLEPDGSRGKLVSELCYPSVPGIGFDAFAREASSIARNELEG